MALPAAVPELEPAISKTGHPVSSLAGECKYHNKPVDTPVCNQGLDALSVNSAAGIVCDLLDIKFVI